MNLANRTTEVRYCANADMLDNNDFEENASIGLRQRNEEVPEMRDLFPSFLNKFLWARKR